MKIICTRENLNNGLVTVSKLASQNINLPILNNILLETKEGQLRLAATNLETGINCFVGGKILEEGSITVPSPLITNYISSLPEGDKITLKAEKEDLLVQTIHNQAKIKGLSASDFPFQYKLINKIKKGIVFKINEAELRQGLATTSFAAAFDELRPEIAGVFFKFHKAGLILAATDSYRLAERKMKLAEKSTQDFEAIVPIKAMQELLYVLKGQQDDQVKIFFNEGQLLFQIHNIDFTTRLTEGQYPDYKQIIPQNLKTKVIVDKEELSQAIKRTSFFTARETSDISLHLNVAKNEILVSAETSQAGSNQSKVQAEIHGQNQEIVYNYRYFLEGLANISSAQVCFETNGQEEPGVLGPAGREEAFLYLVMPIRN